MPPKARTTPAAKRTAYDQRTLELGREVQLAAAEWGAAGDDLRATQQALKAAAERAAIAEDRHRQAVRALTDHLAGSPS
jgi:outer membrane protein TolC